MLYYDVTNRTSAPVVIRATFDVTPAWAAPYFFKAVASLHPIERLEPGEHARVPMVFYVDRRILKDRLAARVNAITLSYTFFRQKGMSDGALASVGDLATRAAGFRTGTEGERRGEIRQRRAGRLTGRRKTASLAAGGCVSRPWRRTSTGAACLQARTSWRWNEM